MCWPSDDRMDRLLEISVDGGPSPALIRLVGTLDHATSRSFLTVINDLVREGGRQLVIDLADADIAASGASALTSCQRWVREAGGSLRWDGVHFGPPETAVADEEVLAPC